MQTQETAKPNLNRNTIVKNYKENFNHCRGGVTAAAVKSDVGRGTSKWRNPATEEEPCGGLRLGVETGSES